MCTCKFEAQLEYFAVFECFFVQGKKTKALHVYYCMSKNLYQLKNYFENG